ncbi:hypothetical protein Pelo_19753 [Pelomyxa schiedti]|nr:hypothetical protein Pelo_19753 [Pelomyxa schiedti]
MIAYSRERLGISWLTTSKFIISHTEACGGPDYEVWDRENPELRPLKEVLLPCHVNPEEERGELWESAGADKLPPQTRMESCCVIQAVNQNQSVSQ